MVPVDPIDGHRAETERLGKLADFVAKFAPAIGEQSGVLSEIESPEGIDGARDVAILEAFKAIERIAKLSFLTPERTVRGAKEI